MPGRGTLQKQLSHIMSVAKAEGYKLEEIMPEEMLEHFNEMTALKEAKEYIKEVESREKDLLAENVGLVEQIALKVAEINNLPEEFKAMKIDLAQALRRCEYYEKLAEDAEIRLERSQHKLAELSKLQSATDEDARKIQRLESELVKHEAAMFKLLEQNRTMADLQDSQQECEQERIGEKDAQIAVLIHHANTLEAEKQEAVELSDKVSETYDTLIQSLEEETLSAADKLNRHSISLVQMVKSNDQLYSTISSEIAPLTSFFHHACSILVIYQNTIQDLVDPKCNTIADLPPSLDTTLDAANEDLLRFKEISIALLNQGLAEEKVRDQVGDLAKVAADMYLMLEGMKSDLTGFLCRLRGDAPAWLASKGLERAPRADRTRCASPAPSFASSSSFISVAKRFSFASFNSPVRMVEE
ncbi:hypothetical protein FB567DRAFT_538451 [Paraphoma chrysanthemicola]|uniref:Uncharacterized protein n=1 Tax=Paraphoma chrysanthemicola TaxID=798071 RepID=A0A8K0QVZ0_9PLEO|nr:hypothetical protein FB567DRAFT_538451 [Paraphoma chrysanthemicola]